MTFSPKDMCPLQTDQNDALVMWLKIVTSMVRWKLIDIGSSVDIITLECLKRLQYNERDLEAVKNPILGFGEQATYSLGTKRLHIQVGDTDNSQIVKTNFLVMDIPHAIQCHPKTTDP